MFGDLFNTKMEFKVAFYNKDGTKPVKELTFISNNRMFGFATLDLIISLPVIREDGYIEFIEKERQYNLSASDLGIFDEEARVLCFNGDVSSKNYYRHTMAKSGMSGIFNVMSALTGYQWYYC